MAEDLIDAQGVAELLGLAQRNTVSAYRRRYPATPRGIVDLGKAGTSWGSAARSSGGALSGWRT